MPIKYGIIRYPAREIYHKRGENIMSQGAFNFKYVKSQNNSRMTSYGGIGIYFDLLTRLDFIEMVNRTVSVSGVDQGWCDWQLLLSVILLNICGGDCVDDISHLSNDEGLCRLVSRFERGLNTRSRSRAREKEKKRIKKRWRKRRESILPSSSALLRYLKRFHRGFSNRVTVKGKGNGINVNVHIPELSEGLRGLGRMNGELIEFMQKNRNQEVATLDMDATLIRSDKMEAQMSYKGFKGYQPVNVYWYEQDMIVHSEFRDGNVPAGYDLKRVFEESLWHVPEGVKQIYLRSDSAGYRYELLDYCHEGENTRFGRIKFCVSSMVSKEFREAVSEVSEKDWHPIYMEIGNRKVKVKSSQEWAEVFYVPSRKGFRIDAPLYRYLAIREKIRQPVFKAFESEEAYDFPTILCGNKRYRVSGLVTNMDWDGEELIHWVRKRCGQSEHIHSIMKNDFSGGKLPCAEFGANACWWLLMIFSLNLHAIIKELILDNSWRRRRMKAVRFWIINIAARVVNRSRQLHIVLNKGEHMAEVLIGWRGKILGLTPLPSG